MRKVLCLAIGLICLWGCGTLKGAHNENDVVYFPQLEVFKTIANEGHYSACLARDASWDYCYVISFNCPKLLPDLKRDIYYDEEKIAGNYVFVGTYTYDTREGEEKTVQAYMPQRNFKAYRDFDKDCLKRLLDIVLSYNALNDK